MAFVNEKIPDVDKQRIDFSKIKHPVHRDSISPIDWTIDRERDIALIFIGGGVGDFPHFFVLYWQGEIINAFLRSTIKGNFPNGDTELTWRLEFLGRLANVAEPEVIDTLKEALFVFGYRNAKYRDKIKAVHFEFNGKHLIGG